MSTRVNERSFTGYSKYAEFLQCKGELKVQTAEEYLHCAIQADSNDGEIVI